MNQTTGVTNIGYKMQLGDKFFFPKDICCPICEKPFTRYGLRRSQFSIGKRDIDYRPIYMGSVNPRLFAVVLCPNCFYAAEEQYFCPKISDDDLRRKQYFASHKAQWEAQSRVRAAGSGKSIWKDMASEKLKEMSPEEISILRRISPLLNKSAANIANLGKPVNEMQKEGSWDVAIRSYELAAICYKARRANHRILGYTYLSGAWTSRDAREKTQDEKKKADYREFEIAYLKEAISFLTITNKSTSVEDVFAQDGSKIPKENMPQARIFEILYILAGAHRLLGNLEDSNKCLEQIIYGNSGAQGIILWFVNQARDMRSEDKQVPSLVTPPEVNYEEESQNDDAENESDEAEDDEESTGSFF
ncbi:MAG: DUF2225 domain-containing protein [Candidatus Riflebacteria bacterium]|nr:DUF2225 domain-containing protein [Candidatus Riflebacteria bacterium]